MERRTYESPMEWEYQNQGPLDPTSPFVTSTRKMQQNDTGNGFESTQSNPFAHNPFTRTMSTPQKPMPVSAQTSTIFGNQIGNQHLQRTVTAPPFRNSAFTTPRKPFDPDAFDDVSAAESSPAATDGSDCADTPETVNAQSLSQMTITPARKALLAKKTPGKGEIPRGALFATRDKVRKRRRCEEDKDISGYRLPYKYSNEWDETDGADSDDSAYEPSRGRSKSAHGGRNQKGWFSNFLSTIQKHPYAPAILGYWLQLAFNLVVVGIVMWILWAIVLGFRDDFWSARQELRAGVVEEMAKCAKDYAENRCAPKEQRLPAMNMMCEEWELCMNQDPDRVRRVQLGAKNIIDIFNEIFDTMHWKTIAAFFILVGMLCWSGSSLFKSTPGTFTPVIHAPQYSQPANAHMLGSPYKQDRFYGAGTAPVTPRHFNGRFLKNDDTDASPSPFKSLPPPESSRISRSPSKGDRGRSPTKIGSPSKRY